MALLFFFLIVAVSERFQIVHSQAGTCKISAEILSNVSLNIKDCANGSRKIEYIISPGNYGCLAPDHSFFSVKGSHASNLCDLSCPPGTVLSSPPPFIGDANQQINLSCVQCPHNTFSVGGGNLIQNWHLASGTSKELLSPFETRCFGFNESRARQRPDGDGWVADWGCSRWRPSTDGSHLSSSTGPDASGGAARHGAAAARVRSELTLRVHVRAGGGRAWFAFSLKAVARVDGDSGLDPAGRCEWMQGDSGVPRRWRCQDGELVAGSTECRDHGGRMQCPPELPWMCAMPNACGGGQAYCCGKDCSLFAGDRLCPDTAGLRLRRCTQEQMRVCKPMPLRKASAGGGGEARAAAAGGRYFVTYQPDWAWAEVDLEPGWNELVWEYVRHGAVAGNDEAQLLEVGWEGSQAADRVCQPCPPGLVSAPGSSRCSRCPAGTVWQTAAAACVACPPGHYALSGFQVCLLRPPCGVKDFVARYGPCQGHPPRRPSWFEWQEPKVCQGGELLPLPTSDAPCEPCPPGHFLTVSSAEVSVDGRGPTCTPCPLGWAGSGLEGDNCRVADFGAKDEKKWSGRFTQACGAGEEAIKERHLGRWESWPSGFSTGCVGACTSPGWRLLGHSTDSGVGGGSGGAIESWLEMVLGSSDGPTSWPAAATAVRFIYRVVGCGAERGLRVTLDGWPVPLSAQCSTESDPIPVPSPGDEIELEERLVLPMGSGRGPGRHVLRWIWFQSDVRRGGGGMTAVSGSFERDAEPESGIDGWAGVILQSIVLELPEDVSSLLLPFPAFANQTFGASRCTPCPPGMFKSTGSAASNTSAVAPDRGRCAPCPLGYAASAAGARACVSCTPGTFSPVRGSSVCRPCGANTTSISAAASCSSVWFSTPPPGASPAQTIPVTGTQASLPVGAGFVAAAAAADERYDIAALIGMVGGPVRLPAQWLPSKFGDGGGGGGGSGGVGGENEGVDGAQWLLYISPAQVLGAGNDDSASVAFAPAECVGVYACIVLTSSGVDMDQAAAAAAAAAPLFLPQEGYHAPPTGVAVGTGSAVNAGAARGVGPLPEFLSRWHRVSTLDAGGTRWRSGGGFTLTLAPGDPCRHRSGEHWVTLVYMVCDPAATSMQPEALEDCGGQPCVGSAGICTRHILWRSAAACPQCTSAGALQIGTPCVNGLRNITYDTAFDCWGREFLPQPKADQPCYLVFWDLFTPEDWWSLGLMLGLLLVFALVIAERSCYYRRHYERYMHLTQQQVSVSELER